MRTHPDMPESPLLELADLRTDPPPAGLEDVVAPARAIVSWAEEYLCRPHPELGRPGPVCPYVQAAMSKGLLFLAVVRGSDFSRREVVDRMAGFRDRFLDLPPRSMEGDAALKTILILFPDLPQGKVPELIDATQEELKPRFVQEGLMIGEFHAGPPDKGGLWNPDFRPLESPLPMLVIRHMVPTDFAFLRHERGFMEAYLDAYGDRIPSHIRDEVREVARSFGIYVPAGAALEAVHPRVAAVLKEHGVPVTVHRHRDMPQPLRGPADVAKALGWSPDRITKSLFLRSRDSSYIVVVAPVTHRVDLKGLARRLGTGRLELATQQELSAWLGFSPGGVSPIATQGVDVAMDASLLDHDTILTAAGEVAVEIEITPEDLRRVTGARVLALLR